MKSISIKLGQTVRITEANENQVGITRVLKRIGDEDTPLPTLNLTCLVPATLERTSGNVTETSLN